MFTGIIQTTATLTGLTPVPAGQRLTLDHGGWTPEGGAPIELGHSICVSGVCLTVAAIDGDTLGFDVIPETLGKTTLGTLTPGNTVNLEPSVTPNQPMGGHFVQGHIDGTGQIVGIDQSDGWVTRIKPDPALLPYIIPKGSVTIDGVSLTIASRDALSFTIALIPTTLELTTLGQRDVGDRVNLESDILTRTVVQTLLQMQEGPGMQAGVNAAEAAPAPAPGGVAFDRSLLQRAGFDD